ncbi:unnamed protein product [Vitrella brassicaformis CCMP3155]|uniref:Uncharacterized protein n=1 Tax=Vitrella brassicaformis (strain CCMP3155) TaxID=1169540 RepID=A0A0G4H306_VITBC|nr:unnamed protein product [Vitrella brassicaformis CCMP3155]|eukprot:CEM37815.1 unnamed protein product [Vitrella brassicaformis CCMP3155]
MSSTSALLAVAVALCLLSSSLAFVPSAPAALRSRQQQPKRSVMRAQATLDDMVGGDGPEPFSRNFDPLGLAEQFPQYLTFFREAEIKHGRIAMLAVLGMVVPSFWTLPGREGISVLAAHDKFVENGVMGQLLFWVSLWEIVTFKTVVDMDEKDREPGDFSMDPFGWTRTPERARVLRTQELKNGRLAMLAFSGMITQAALTGKNFPFF